MTDGSKEDVAAAAVIDLLRQTDPVRRMLGEAAERTAADRRALLDQLAAIEIEADVTMPKLAADLVKAADRVRTAEERLKGATQAFGATAGAKLSASVEFDRRRDGLRQQLREGADNAVIDAFRTWLLDEQAAAHRQPIEMITVGAVRNEITGRRQEACTTTNKVSIDRRLAAILAALRGLDDLRLIGDQRDVPAAIAALKAGLPAITPPQMPPQQESWS